MLTCVGHVERMDEHSTARFVLMTEAKERQGRGRPTFGEGGLALMIRRSGEFI